MRIFIDTNVFLRFLLDEDSEQHRDSVKLFAAIAEGKFSPYTSNIVVAEITHVLTRIYKQPKSIVLSSIEKLLTIRNLTIIEKTNTKDAVKLYKTFSMKFGDCLIATQVPNGVTLVTYDTDFLKVKHLRVATPTDMLK